MSNDKQSSVEWLKKVIDNELKVIDNLYGKEIMGRKIGLAFVKRILEQAKEMHKQEIIEGYRFGVSDEYVIGSQKYYNEHFGI
jgi:hypothetical protein